MPSVACLPCAHGPWGGIRTVRGGEPAESNWLPLTVYGMVYPLRLLRA